MNCKNCNTEFTDTQKFCFECGEKVKSNRITVRSLAIQFNEEFLSIDNKLLKTFRDLITKPEVVIDYYLSGLRKRYINIVSYLALSITLFGFQFYILQTYYSDNFSNTNESTGDKNLDDLIVEISDRIGDLIGIVTILFIPVIALSTYIIFSNKKIHNYAEHIVINTFVTAQYTILFVLAFFLLIPFGIDVRINFLLTTVLSYAYIGYCLKRIYKLSIFETLWKTVLTLLIYSFMTGIITLLIVALVGLIFYFFLR